MQNERSVKDFLRTAPENILVKYKNGSSLSARIRRRLRQLLPGEVPDFETLAAELNMTPATLRRRLHEEGASYQGIKDQLRRDLGNQLPEPLGPQRHGYRPGVGLLRTQRLPSRLQEMDRGLPR